MLIDLVRAPAYFAVEHESLRNLWHLIALAIAAVVLGTFAGEWLLRRVPQRLFSRIVSGILMLIGVLLFFQRPT